MEQIDLREEKLEAKIREVKKEVLSQIDLSKDSSDEEIQKLIFETVFRHSKEEFLLSTTTFSRISRASGLNCLQ